LRSKDQQPQNVVEENCTKALAPTAIFWNPNRRTGGEQLPFDMCWLPYYYDTLNSICSMFD